MGHFHPSISCHLVGDHIRNLDETTTDRGVDNTLVRFFVDATPVSDVADALFRHISTSLYSSTVPHVFDLSFSIFDDDSAAVPDHLNSSVVLRHFHIAVVPDYPEDFVVFVLLDGQTVARVVLMLLEHRCR